MLLAGSMLAIYLYLLIHISVRGILKANLRTYILTGLTILATFMLASPAQAQSNATDSTFFPLHQGNRWVYEVSLVWDTFHHVYETGQSLVFFGDSLIVWPTVRHSLALTPIDAPFSIPEHGVDLLFDLNSNRIYGSAPSTYGHALLADFNAEMGDEWEVWRYRPELALDDYIVYRKVRNIRFMNIAGKLRKIIDFIQHTGNQYGHDVDYHSFTEGIGYSSFSCRDCYGSRLSSVRINGEVLFGDITVSNEDERADTPDAFRLDAAYPNPFNPTTTLRFALKHTGEVSLAVYDVLGRQVLAQNLGTLHAGKHHHTLDMSSRPSGTYLVRMQSGGQVRSTLITLLK